MPLYHIDITLGKPRLRTRTMAVQKVGHSSEKLNDGPRHAEDLFDRQEVVVSSVALEPPSGVAWRQKRRWLARRQRAFCALCQLFVGMTTLDDSLNVS